MEREKNNNKKQRLRVCASKSMLFKIPCAWQKKNETEEDDKKNWARV